LVFSVESAAATAAIWAGDNCDPGVQGCPAISIMLAVAIVFSYSVIYMLNNV
jgi:hypothetical protein